MEADNRIREALRALIDRALDRVQGHPAGHLLSGERERLEIALELPMNLLEEDLDKASLLVQKRLDDAVHGLLTHRAIFRPGRVLCLRCRSSDCEHASPCGAKTIFRGYSQSGEPRFVDYGEHLLESQDPRVGELFGEADRLVTRVVPGKKLMERLLPSIREDAKGYRIHGQVLAGWYRIPDRTGRNRAMALSFQIISSQPKSRRRRYGLNVLGVGPGQESLEHLHDRLRPVPWTSSVRWAQSVLRTMDKPEQRRLEGLLTGLARRLERGVRSSGRRTSHAEIHHEGGDRPTRMALMDLARARDADLLVDRRHNTRIVLGQRGRCHVFSAAGKLVTSVRYPPGSIERKRNSGTWRSAEENELSSLRALAAQVSSDNSDKIE